MTKKHIGVYIMYKTTLYLAPSVKSIIEILNENLDDVVIDTNAVKSIKVMGNHNEKGNYMPFNNLSKEMSTLEVAQILFRSKMEGFDIPLLIDDKHHHTLRLQVRGGDFNV